jgi:hypothetical protein
MSQSNSKLDGITQGLNFDFYGSESIGANIPQFPPFPTFPQFPTLNDLLEVAPTAPPKPRGVFQELMSSRPEYILQSAEEYPGRYDDRALSLLRAIYNNTTSYEALSPNDQELINQATMEFFQRPPIKEPRKASLGTSQKQTAIIDDGPIREEPIEGPIMDAFWWT